MNAQKVQRFYNKNVRFAIGRDHTMTVQLEDFDVESDNVQLNSEDFPYLRLALLDKLIENQE